MCLTKAWVKKVEGPFDLLVTDVGKKCCPEVRVGMRRNILLNIPRIEQKNNKGRRHDATDKWLWNNPIDLNPTKIMFR